MHLIFKKILSFVPVGVLCGMLFAGFFVSPEQIPGRGLCTFKHIFYLDCPGCGLTRAFLLIPQGKFVEALSYNFASIFIYLFFILLLVQAVFKTFHRDITQHNFFKKINFVLGYAIIILLFAHWIYKIYVYFLDHSLTEYMSLLIRSREFWLL